MSIHSSGELTHLKPLKFDSFDNPGFKQLHHAQCSSENGVGLIKHNYPLSSICSGMIFEILLFLASSGGGAWICVA